MTELQAIRAVALRAAVDLHSGDEFDNDNQMREAVLYTAEKFMAFIDTGTRETSSPLGRAQ